MTQGRDKDTPKLPIWKRALRRGLTMTGTASVIAVAAGAVWLGSTTLATRAAAVDAPPPAPTSTVAALRISPSQDMTVTRQFHGQVEAAQNVSLSFEQSGRLNVLTVDEGDRVTAGQVVARLDTRILDAEMVRLEASRASLEAQAELSRRTTKRQTELRARGHVSDQAVDNVALNLAALNAQIAEVDAAITRITVELSQTEMTAPFDGTIGARHVDAGAVMSVGAPVIDIRETAKPLFRVGIDPKLANRVDTADARITIDGTAYPARFVGFRPDLDAQTRTRTALFEIDADTPAFLTSGTLELRARIEQSGYAVPLRALRDGVRGLWTVLVLSPGDDGLATVDAAAVEVMQIEGDTAYVRGTLTGTALILPDGTHRVVPGDRVRLSGDN
ncbi:efflux RND transporter periplasmic adaptor subunit [uncultured Tateyamaria sp.]|uniref:efflux RND transporter periplasmic adaptor subunit n=1 Tax=uncultured Tateyamaria sp. TaxID=455651 RepID=UPI002602F02A|nr:efflux RND transporter periplasmic adaptor subunit [uncultured Tateyamaria sp.]